MYKSTREELVKAVHDLKVGSAMLINEQKGLGASVMRTEFGFTVHSIPEYSGAMSPEGFFGEAEVEDMVFYILSWLK